MNQNRIKEILDFFNFDIDGTKNNSLKIKKRLLIRSFMNIYKTNNYINNKENTNMQVLKLDNHINEIILDSLNKIKNQGDDKWVYCSRACKEISELFKKEIHSTLYILNILSNSLVTTDESKIKFIFNDEFKNLTGKWENDSQYFTFEIFNNNIQQTQTETKLLMGFGPSSSGKTYCAKTIIQLLSSNNPSFPKSFLSIDGGIYREKSYIYQKVIDFIKQKGFNGLKNLVLSGVHLKRSATNKAIEQRQSLFDSNIVKKIVIKYLENRGKPTSLYVPETLGGCFIDCESTYNKYIKISQDEKGWIGLLIWQHKTHKDCTFEPRFQCKGCTESGKIREKDEGKIYSSSAWENSMRNGRNEMMKAPGGNYEIHNGGGYSYYSYKNKNKKTVKVLSRSTITDYSRIRTINPNQIPEGFVIGSIKKESIILNLFKKIKELQ